MVTLYIAVSIDGRIAGEDDDLSWLELAGSGGRDGDYGYSAFHHSVDVTVLGRGTWDVCKRFDPWPYSGGECVVITRRTDLVPVANESFEPFDADRWRERKAREHQRLRATEPTRVDDRWCIVCVLHAPMMPESR